MADNKIDLNKDSKEKIPKTRQLNFKNIGKALAVLIGGIFLVIFTFDFFKNDKEIEEKAKENDIFAERDVNSELDKQDYSNSRVIAANEKLIEDIPQEDEEEYNPDYDVPAQEDDPIAEYIKQQELEKVKRRYEARASGFNKHAPLNLYGEGDMSHETNAPAYSGMNDSDYMKYITAGIGEVSNPNMQKEKIQFMKNAAVSNFLLKEVLSNSITKYEVKAGTFIPVTIAVGIDSDLPGHFSAIVREDVYDTNTGTELLIPMGSKVFGTFSSEVSWGQTRIQAVFNRLTLPNGKSINLEAMGVSDLDGKSGLDANVDLRLGKVFGSIIMAAVIGGAEGALTNNGRYDKDRNAVLSGAGEAGGDKTIETIDKFTSKLIDVQPKLTKEFGGRANIVVDKDIILEKYDSTIEYLVN
ncbi:TrbI/VirB10 family protein [Fusobacterium gastrosuis]|uniref:TrbI/VirB10 family protein n=1 Tax=Fusobacterium gastrosuis TaxID=1755100 RepID=UPI002A9E2FF7|nr:TrbI/VirB10 family protein [Fusobacterium gastrosuis]